MLQNPFYAVSFNFVNELGLFFNFYLIERPAMYSLGNKFACMGKKIYNRIYKRNMGFQLCLHMPSLSLLG